MPFLIEEVFDHMVCEPNLVQDPETRDELEHFAEAHGANAAMELFEYRSDKSITQVQLEDLQLVVYEPLDLSTMWSSKKPTKPATKRTKPKEFTCFNKLSPELRSKIWEEALPKPQIIEFHQTPGSLSNGKMSTGSHRTLIGMLLACHESYHTVMSRYKCMSFDYTTMNPAQHRRPITLNLRTDVIYFTAVEQIIYTMIATFHTTKISCLHTIAMPAAVFKYFVCGDAPAMFMQWIMKLTNLKSIVLVGRESRKQTDMKLKLMVYYGTICYLMAAMKDAWDTQCASRELNIPLISVNPYSNGRLALGADHGH